MEDCSSTSSTSSVPSENDYDVGVKCKFLEASESETCEVCVPGKVSSSTTNELCTDCPEDHYNPSYGATSCEECEATLNGPEGSSSKSMCFSSSSLWSNLYMTGSSRVSKQNENYLTSSHESNDWSPRSISFIKRDTFLAMDNNGKVYEYSSDSMTRIGTFASTNAQAITSVLYLGHLDLVAVGAEDGIYFFALEDGLGGGNLGESSSDRSISIQIPKRFALGEFEDELLIITDTDSVDTITRKCVPGTSCSSGREGVIVSDPTSKYNFFDVAVLKERGVILVTVYSTVDNSHSVRSCPLSGSEMDIDMDCSLFENKRPTSMENKFTPTNIWLPDCVEVDMSKKVVYVLGNHRLFVLDFDGNYIRRANWADTTNYRYSFAFRPHEAFQISKIQSPASASKAGTVIELPLDVNDHRNISLSEDFDFLQVADKITVRAEGYIQTVQDGLVAKIDVAGDVEHSGTSMTAKLGINSAGVWTVHVSGESGGVQVEFMNSPFILTVEPEVTDASKTEVIHLTSDIVAGEKFVGRFKLYDAYQNPTNWAGDRLYAEPVGDLIKSDGVWEYSSKQALTTSGTHTIDITLGSDEVHVNGSPFEFTVTADVPDITKCADSVKNMKKDFFSSGSTFTGAMELSATPRDQYSNLVLDALGFEAHVRLISGGIPGEAQIVALSAGDQYKAEVPVAENSESVIEVGIKYNDEFLDGSPKIITIKPDSEIDLGIILGVVAAGVLLVSVGLWRFMQKREKRKVNMIRKNFSAQRFNLEMELVGVCWDDMMLGCLLEYIDGGSLEDRLKKDWTQPMSDRMTWKGALLSLAKDAANGVRYLHHSRYYDENEETWKDCIIHRDLKPDNMLVTKDNVLKLTDFGEARAADLSMTMTAVGTPIYISPEVMRNDRYDLKADTYSFGVVLAAMVRADKNIVDFFFSQLQKKMKRKNRQGIGIGSLNRYLDKGWRPPLPVEFYPKMSKLISRCWAVKPKDRPDFDQIYEELSGPITLEVQLNPEPMFGSGIVITPAEGEDWDEEGGDMETQRLGSMSLQTGDSLEPSLETMNLSDMLQSERMKTEQLVKEVENLKKQIEGFKAQPTIVDFGVGKQKQQPTVVKFGVEEDTKMGMVGGGGGGGGKQQPPIVRFAVEDQKVDEIGGASGITGGEGGGVASIREEEKGEEKVDSNPFANIFYNG
ncbi:hypothetical protein TrVE_jg2680 [Triparma verrucosa]|uniref:Protein kinase domain-containing protein n=1 Tax=Triparma verrucosa TaxID=1606542 RepID=A0A9W7EPF3_9STRA|nr:hypothetical protein TrVE_jg2680 [Triparma verrucosa]